MGCVRCCWPLFPSAAPATPSLSNTPPQQRAFSRYHGGLTLHLKRPIRLRAAHSSPLKSGGGGGGGGGKSRGKNNGGSGWEGDEDDDGSSGSGPNHSILLLSLLFCCSRLRLARAESVSSSDSSDSGWVWEVKGGKWSFLVPHKLEDSFVISSSTTLSFGNGNGSSHLEVWMNKCRDVLMRLMLPDGFPESVTPDYLDYSLWRAVQGVASQISSVLATQSLLYAVGLGKGAIPTAAAVNWVLKDGIGYLSKIMLSKYGRHFDVHPKGWRLFADLLENAAFGLEMLTPAFPHLFVQIGAVAGAGRSAAALIQAATRSCFFAGFAAQRNFAEVIAKGEAQGMLSKFFGIIMGIGLANCIGTSTSLALASFSVVTCIHMYCNLKSYQCIQLRTLNPYRASLVFSEYLLSGQAPPIKEVNDEEPLFPAVPVLNVKPVNKEFLGERDVVQGCGLNDQFWADEDWECHRSDSGEQSPVLSAEAKVAAAEIDNRLQLGSKLSDIVNNNEDVLALFSLYTNEGYILTEHKGRFCVVLKETCSQHDMLKALFHVNYLYWLEKNAGIEGRSPSLDCKPGGRLQISLDYVGREFNHVKNDGESVGWTTDGLIARPLPIRIRPGFVTSPNTLADSC